jgi:hypothetical protein
MTLGTATSGNDLSADTGTDLQATTLKVGRDGKLNAGSALTLKGPVTTGRHLDMRANEHLGFASVDAGGHVFGQSFKDSIDGDSVSASDWIRFIAARDINIHSLKAATDVTLQAGRNIATDNIDAGHDVDVQGGGDIAMHSTTAGHAIKVDAGGALKIHDMHAGHSLDLAARTMSFVSLEAPDSIRLLARDGDITGTSLTTRDAYVAARGAIDLDAANIGNRINLAAATIDAHIVQTTTGQPLYSVMTGFQDGVAKRITVDADVPEQWMIDRLSAVNAALVTTAPSVHIEKGHIEDTMSLDTAQARLRMNQHSAVLVPADVQLTQSTYDFLLYQDGVHTMSNAFIVRYGYGFEIQTPNYAAPHNWLAPDYYGDAALRFNGRILTEHTDGVDDPTDKRAIPQWINADSSQLVQPAPSSDGIAVNTKAPR